MAYRKTYYGLEPVSFNTINLPIYLLINKPGANLRSEPDLNRYIELFKDNTMLDKNNILLNKKSHNLDYSYSSTEYLISVLIYMNFGIKFKEKYPNSPCEICPRYDLESRNRGYVKINLLIRYYCSEEIISEIEDFIRQFYEIGSIVEGG